MAMAGWFGRAPEDIVGGAETRNQVLLKQQIGAHVAAGHDLAAKSGQRQVWLSERHLLLETKAAVSTRPGGTGLSFDETQVLARKSLVELSQAAAALRAAVDLSDAARRRARLRGALDRNNTELMRSPGAAWMEIIREDFRDAVNLRYEVARFDVNNQRDRHDFLRTGAQLIARCADAVAGAGAQRARGRGAARGHGCEQRAACAGRDRHQR